MAPPVRKWDQFRVVPPKEESGSDAHSWVSTGEKVILALAYVLTCGGVFLSAVVSKGVTFFMIAQTSVHRGRNVPYCNLTGTNDYELDLSCLLGGQALGVCEEQRRLERIAWIWALVFAYSVPQAFTFLSSLRQVVFKNVRRPRFLTFLFATTMEACHTAGLAMLVFLVLPEMDTVRGLAVSTATAAVPGLLLVLSRFRTDDENKGRIHWAGLLLDIPALLGQLSAAVLWPALQYVDNSTEAHPYPWAIPAALVLASCGWWETYAEEDSAPLGWMYRMKSELIERSRHPVYLFLSPLKAAVFLAGAVVIPYLTGGVGSPWQLFEGFHASFANHTFHVVKITDTIIDGGPSLDPGVTVADSLYIDIDDPLTPVWVFLIQVKTALSASVSPL